MAWSINIGNPVPAPQDTPVAPGAGALAAVGAAPTAAIGGFQRQPSAGAETYTGAAPSVTQSGTGATLVFSYPSGFQSATFSATNDGSQTPAQQFNLAWNASVESTSPYRITINQNTHSAAAFWYNTKQNIASGWTTDFTFEIATGGYGITFGVQNSNSTINPSAYGIGASADANGEGYAAYRSLQPNTAIANSFGINFDNTGQNGNANIGTTPSTIGLFLNGANDMAIGFVGGDNLASDGIAAANGNIMSVHAVYDGSKLTVVYKDTVTGAQVRKVWPLAASTVIGSSNAWIGFMGGTVTAAYQRVNSWSFWQGYNTKLSTPNISPVGGMYASAQTVSITADAGASIYYTTDGKLPTTNDSLYTGSFSVSADTIVNAVAVRTNYTDSDVSQAGYQIGSSRPVINFSSGFSGAGNLVALNGVAAISGANLQLTPSSTDDAVGSAFYVAPVAVNGFTTSFKLNFNSGNAQGLCFVIQNQLPASAQSNNYNSGPYVVSGGPNALGATRAGMGYQGILESVALKFDIRGDGTTTNRLGVYTTGAQPGGSGGNSVSPVTFQTGHDLNVTLAYNDTTKNLAVSIVDAVNSNSYSTNFTIDIPTIVGGSTAYVGFTGSSYYNLHALQQVKSWTM